MTGGSAEKAMKILPIGRRIGMLLAGLLIVAGWDGWTLSQASSQARPGAKLSAVDSVEAHLGKGYDALKQDRYDLAANEFRAALDLDPKLVLRARFPLAVALFELHQSDESRRELEAVHREVGDHPNVLYYLGRLDLADRKFESAIRNLSKAAAKPPFPDTAYYLGYAYFKQGNLTAAEKWLREGAYSNPRDARIPYQLSFVYRKEGREEEAKKAVALSEELRRHDDNDSRLRLECVQKLDQGLRDEARTICEQLDDPNNPEKLTELGTIYGQHGELEAALRPLRRAAELAPQSPQMQYNLALAYYQLNRFEDARASLVDTVKRWPDLFQVNSLYGAALLKLGEEIPAYQALSRAHQLNSQDSATTDLLYSTILGLAQKSQTARQYPEALHYLQQAANLRPREPEPHRHMAELHKLDGHPAEATKDLQEASRLAQSLGRPQ
jgi:tetratricopeptide (TPR) repeat protein